MTSLQRTKKGSPKGSLFRHARHLVQLQGSLQPVERLRFFDIGMVRNSRCWRYGFDCRRDGLNRSLLSSRLSSGLCSRSTWCCRATVARIATLVTAARLLVEQPREQPVVATAHAPTVETDPRCTCVTASVAKAKVMKFQRAVFRVRKSNPMQALRLRFAIAVPDVFARITRPVVMATGVTVA